MVSDIPFGRILHASPQGDIQQILEYGGQPNGLKVDAKGCIFIADFKIDIMQLDPATGSISTALGDADSESLKNRNDLYSRSTEHLFRHLEHFMAKATKHDHRDMGIANSQLICLIKSSREAEEKCHHVHPVLFNGLSKSWWQFFRQRHDSMNIGFTEFNALINDSIMLETMCFTARWR